MGLPAIPFEADIIENECRCVAPQKCDGSIFTINEQGEALYIMQDDESEDVLNPETSNPGFGDNGIVNVIDEGWGSRNDCMVVTETVRNQHRDKITTYLGPYWPVLPENEMDDVLYWSQEDVTGMSIFWDIESGYWQIGWIDFSGDNLICYRGSNLSLCTDWIDDSDRNVYHLKVLKVDCNINMTQIAVEVEPESHELSIMTLTFYGILGECGCLVMVYAYCKRRPRRSKGREYLPELSSSEECAPVELGINAKRSPSSSSEDYS